MLLQVADRKDIGACLIQSHINLGFTYGVALLHSEEDVLKKKDHGSVRHFLQSKKDEYETNCFNKIVIPASINPVNPIAESHIESPSTSPAP